MQSSLASPRDVIDSNEDLDEASDFGTYSVILPSEPFVFGVGHIRTRPVPEHIALPPYVASLPLSRRHAGEDERPFNGDPYSGDGKIELGGEAETHLRAAARLAKKTLDFAGSLVKVCIAFCFLVEEVEIAWPSDAFLSRLASLLRPSTRLSMTSSQNTMHIRLLSCIRAFQNPAARVSTTLSCMVFRTGMYVFCETLVERC